MTLFLSIFEALARLDNEAGLGQEVFNNFKNRCAQVLLRLRRCQKFYEKWEMCGLESPHSP